MTATLLHTLHASLDRRIRPEDLLAALEQLLGARLSPNERRQFQQARVQANQFNPFGWSSRSRDFHRPGALDLQVAGQLFITPLPPMAERTNVARLGQYLEAAGAEIGKRSGHNDFLRDRLNQAARHAAGLELSRRQYNKRFRLAQRLERKRATLTLELEKRTLTLMGKSRLASTLSLEAFAADEMTAAFIAYYTARCHVRSEFTNTAQARPYDELADLLFGHCRGSATTNWWAIAHVYPDVEVLANLSDDQKGMLLGRFSAVRSSTAELMGEVWATSTFERETMIVRRGNDSST